MKIRLFCPILPQIVFLLLLACAQLAVADTASTRFSFAISGGASMGAYEAGLIWGLITGIRRVEYSKEWSISGETRPIEITSVTGTSAGGINTLLAALAWSVKPEDQGGFTNRIDDNIFRDVWLTPDVNRLLPPTADSSLYSVHDALLSRQDLVTVARDLRMKWNRPGTFRPGLRLPLGVAVTRVRPDTMSVSGVSVNNQRFYIPFEIRTRPDGSVQFGFDPNDYPDLTDPTMILMPWPEDSVPFSISDQQVEDALMTSSAFPIGFGRKRFTYCREKDYFAVTEGDDPLLTAGTDGPVSEKDWVCPEGYELTESEFADGGLFDNLPIGLARMLSESSEKHKKDPLPVRYIYLDPDRRRYETPMPADKGACQGEKPPEACRWLTYDLASETAVLGGAVGTARKSSLFQELTSDKWRLNLSHLSRNVADVLDEKKYDANCDSTLPYFDPSQGCSDSIRYTARLMELAHGYRFAPIQPPLSESALLVAGIARQCRPSPKSNEVKTTAECRIDIPQLRKELASVLVDLIERAAPEEEKLINDIHRSSLSIDSDRLLYVSDRGGPITGLLLGGFGAFFDYKFREYDYYVGVYDAIVAISTNQCKSKFPEHIEQEKISTCRDRLSRQLYDFLHVADNPRSRYAFARMARQEFGKEGGLRYAYDPIPPEDRDIRIIHEGLNEIVLDVRKNKDQLEGVLATERGFFEYLKAEGFAPTPPPEGEKALLTLIMDDPDYWSNELVKRATNRLVTLEREADAIYRAREPDPTKRERANAGLMGATALALQTATYRYPKFSFAPSVSPESWFWRNIIPYEAAFDFIEGDGLFFWQPTWNFKYTNAGIRFGLGFTSGVSNSSADHERKNYGSLGLDFTRFDRTVLFSGWGLTPSIYHNWAAPSSEDQTSFGMDIHAYFFKNRVRISLGMRDIMNNAEDTLFLTVGLADLPGFIYWLSR